MANHDHDRHDQVKLENEKHPTPSVADFVSKLRHEFDEFRNQTTSTIALLESHVERIEKRLG